MAGEGPPSTTFLAARDKVVDAGLRRHDDVGDVGVSIVRAPGIMSDCGH
jgi:hypothetical protein